MLPNLDLILVSLLHCALLSTVLLAAISLTLAGLLLAFTAAVFSFGLAGVWYSVVEGLTPHCEAMRDSLQLGLVLVLICALRCGVCVVVACRRTCRVVVDPFRDWIGGDVALRVKALKAAAA